MKCSKSEAKECTVHSAEGNVHYSRIFPGSMCNEVLKKYAVCSVKCSKCLKHSNCSKCSKCEVFKVEVCSVK